MKKYEKMVERNRLVSREKCRIGKTAIQDMFDREEPIKVSALSAGTGLSRAFFYKNPEVRECLDNARTRQSGMVYLKPQKAVIDKAMESHLKEIRKELKVLQEEKERLTQENIRLTEENRKLKAALERRDRKLLRSL